MGTNKEDLLAHIEGKPKIKGIDITGYFWEEEPVPVKILLRIGYAETDWEEFLEKLDIKDGPKFFEIAGTIWYEGGSWSETEADAYDLWQYRSVPEIPKNL